MIICRVVIAFHLVLSFKRLHKTHSKSPRTCRVQQDSLSGLRKIYYAYLDLLQAFQDSSAYLASVGLSGLTKICRFTTTRIHQVFSRLNWVCVFVYVLSRILYKTHIVKMRKNWFNICSEFYHLQVHANPDYSSSNQSPEVLDCRAQKLN